MSLFSFFSNVLNKRGSNGENTESINSPHKKEEHPLTEIVRFSLIALIIVVPIRVFIAQPFIVSGDSMKETFQSGQYLIVDQLSYHFNEPKRGDVIIFRFPKDISKYFIKRIIAVPGDTIIIDGDIVTIKNKENPKGVTLKEPYVAAMQPNTRVREELGEGEYYVMGDNRDASLDSRAWGILHEDKIVGRALIRLFPLTTISTLPGEYNIDAELSAEVINS